MSLPVFGLLALLAQMAVAPLPTPARDPSGTGLAWSAVSPGTMAVAAVAASVAGDPVTGAHLARSPANRLSDRELEWVDGVAAGLTLEEKVGQLVIAWIEGGSPEVGSPRWERAMRLVEAGVGGLIVGEGPGHRTASWLEALQAWAKIPLLVAADLEWGPGTRLEGATVLPVNMAIAAAGGPDMAYEAGRITALEGRAAGIHMAFAPVADVNVNPLNPVINTRSYGSDPAGVADRVVAFIEGARDGGLLTVVKHFPGHGDTDLDSHLAMPVLDVPRPRLDQVELRPFSAAIGAGVDGVMSAHLAVPALDEADRPATLSSAIMTDLLRRELGFDGLVVTDALHMDGVTESGSPGEVAVAALAAGADVLLIPPDEDEAIDAVVQAVREGELSEARIDVSVRRVLAAKAAAGLGRRAQVNPIRIPTDVSRGEHEAWSRWVTERSVTVPRAAAGALPLRVAGRSVLFVTYDHRSRRVGEAFEDGLRDRGATVRTQRLNRRSPGSALNEVRAAARKADVVVFAGFTRAVPWRGTLSLPDRVAALAAELADVGAPVLSFGDPYLLRHLPDAPTYLLAWDRTDAAQVAAVRALTGEIPITGRLPIDLPPDYVVGDGLFVPTASPAVATGSPDPGS